MQAIRKLAVKEAAYPCRNVSFYVRRSLSTIHQSPRESLSIKRKGDTIFRVCKFPHIHDIMKFHLTHHLADGADDNLSPSPNAPSILLGP